MIDRIPFVAKVALPIDPGSNATSKTESPRNVWTGGYFHAATDQLPCFAGLLFMQYTLCKPCCVDGEPDAHTVWLKVGVQSFCVTSFACETKDEAEWTRDMLAKALATVVAESANDQAHAQRLKPKS